MSTDHSTPTSPSKGRGLSSLTWPGLSGLRLGGHGDELLKGASLSLALRVLAVVFGLLFNLLVARKYGAEGAGIYGLAITVVTMCVTFSLLGLDLASVKTVAAAASTKDWWRVKRISLHGTVIVLSLSSIFALAVFFGRAPLSNHVFDAPALEDTLQFMALAIVPLALARVVAAYQRGTKRLLEALMSEAVLVPLLATLVLVAAANGGVEDAGVAYLAACTVAAIFALSMWRRFIRRQHAPRPETARGPSARNLVNVGVPIMAVAVADFSTQWITIYMVGFLGEAREVGLYRISLQIVALLGFLMTANNSIAAPKIAASFHSGDLTSVSQIWRISTAMLMIVGVPCALVVIIFPAFLLSWFGEEFIAAQTVLLILALGQLVNLATGPVGVILIMTGRERLSLLSSSAAALLVAVLSVLLIPAYGASGAAIALSVGLAARKLLATYFVWKVVGLRLVARGAT